MKSLTVWTNANEVVFFTRSGYLRSPGETTLAWDGDQLVSWDDANGIKSAVTGLLSSGFSGYSLNHSDTGGYTTLTTPPFNYRRDQELLMRWMELSALTVVYRTHEGNQPGVNVQVYSNDATLNQFARTAKIYQA